jgi:hypothetical protein
MERMKTGSPTRNRKYELKLINQEIEISRLGMDQY